MLEHFFPPYLKICIQNVRGHVCNMFYKILNLYSFKIYQIILVVENIYKFKIILFEMLQNLPWHFKGYKTIESFFTIFLMFLSLTIFDVFYLLIILFCNFLKSEILKHYFQISWKLKINLRQAGAELGQAQLKLELGFTSANLHWKVRQLVLLYSLTRPTFHFTIF